MTLDRLTGHTHLLFMPPTLKKLKGHIALSLSIRPSKTKFRVFKFHRWIPHQKITEQYCFFKVWINPLCGVMPILKVHNEILKSSFPKPFTARSFKLGQLIEDNE